MATKNLEELARDLERAQCSAADAARDFVQALGIGKRTRTAIEVKVPGYMLADLADAVQEWKDAGEALIQAQRKAG